MIEPVSQQQRTFRAHIVLPISAAVDPPHARDVDVDNGEVPPVVPDLSGSLGQVGHATHLAPN